MAKLLWSNVDTFTTTYLWFGELQEATVNPLLMVWNLEEVAVKQFAAANPLLMDLHLQEVAVKQFANFYT